MCTLGLLHVGLGLFNRGLQVGDRRIVMQMLCYHTHISTNFYNIICDNHVDPRRNDVEVRASPIGLGSLENN